MSPQVGNTIWLKKTLQMLSLVYQIHFHSVFVLAKQFVQILCIWKEIDCCRGCQFTWWEQVQASALFWLPKISDVRIQIVLQPEVWLCCKKTGKKLDLHVTFSLLFGQFYFSFLSFSQENIVKRLIVPYCFFCKCICFTFK